MSQLTLAEGAAPSTPASGYLTVYAKTDGFLYYKDDAGNERRAVYAAELGTMAVQNANAVAITGGTITDATLDGLTGTDYETLAWMGL